MSKKDARDPKLQTIFNDYMSLTDRNDSGCNVIPFLEELKKYRPFSDGRTKAGRWAKGEIALVKNDTARQPGAGWFKDVYLRAYEFAYPEDAAG